MLLALAAFLLTHTGLPLSAVRPMACMAAAVGAAVSAAVLACRLQKRLLLCGLGCGAFYAVCLLAATLLASGRLDWQGCGLQQSARTGSIRRRRKAGRRWHLA